MHREKLLDAIRKYQFYALELNLYLDNFPSDEKASKDFAIVSHKLNSLVHKYESEFAPLVGFGMTYKTNPEKWVNSPWPWESKH